MLSQLVLIALVFIATLLTLYDLSNGRFWSASVNPFFHTEPPHQARLKLDHQDKFRIAIFADLHYGEEENSWGIDQDIKSTRVMQTVLDHEHPDLVVLSMEDINPSSLLSIDKST